MATVGSAKSTLVDKINSLTAAATPKDTIFLAKALGEATSLTNFVWQGTWSTGTEYAIDDVVIEGVSSYVCIQAHTAGATFSGDSAKWDAIAVGANVPDQTGNSGKVLKTDGSTLEWGDGLPTGGTSGQFITTDGSTASWGDVSQKVLQVKTASNTTKHTTTASVGTYYDNNSAGAGVQVASVSMTRMSSTSRILVWGHTAGHSGGNAGAATGLFFGSTRLAMSLANGYSQDNFNGACHANIASSTVGDGAVTYQYRLLGTRTGDPMTSYYYTNTTDMGSFYSSITVMEVEA